MANKPNPNAQVDRIIAEAGGRKYLLESDARYSRVVETRKPDSDPISALFRALGRIFGGR